MDVNCTLSMAWFLDSETTLPLFQAYFVVKNKGLSTVISGPFALSPTLLGFKHYRPDKVQLSSFIELYRQVKHCLCLQKEQAYWPEIRDHISISVWFKIELNYRVERSLFVVYKEHSNSHYGRAPTFWRKNGTGAQDPLLIYGNMPRFPSMKLL